MKPDQINWEAMQAALEQLRINCISGNHARVQGELIYLLDRLIPLQQRERTLNLTGDDQ